MIEKLGDIPWIPVFIPGSSKTRIPVKDLEIYVLQGCCCIMSELDAGNAGVIVRHCSTTIESCFRCHIPSTDHDDLQRSRSKGSWLEVWSLHYAGRGIKKKKEDEKRAVRARR